jgi:signal transduction histidine kinase
MIEAIPCSSPTVSETYALPASLLHDLRTPLNLIIGYSELLMDQAGDEGHESFVPDLDQVRSAGRDLLKLINNSFSSLVSPIAPPARAKLSDIPSNGAYATAAAPTLLPELAQVTVLVVDDSESNREILARRLKGQGYSVITAENGRIAMETVRKNDFDMVLLDVMMPEMDGFEVLKRLKSDEQFKHIPVVMISALSEMESVVRCIEMGADDYLPKPFDPTLLRARAVACVERKRAHDKEAMFAEELQQSYARAQALERMRDDLTNMIVHDLRSPLTSVVSGLKTLEIDSELNNSQRELVDISLSGGSTLLGMINDLLDVNKMECGSLQLDLTEIQPENLVSRARKQLSALADSKNLELTSEIDPELPLILVDSHKMLRTLVNLLGNAIKFTSPGGIVRIRVARDMDGESLLFSISDSGEGIPADEFERIFEKFGQIESRKAGHTYSTGLGLTLCKMVVEAHGGRIWVESEMDSGSTFYFTVPFVTSDDGTDALALRNEVDN